MERDQEPVIRPDSEDVRARWKESLAHAAESAYRRASADEMPTQARRARWRIEPRTALSFGFVTAIVALVAWALVGGEPDAVAVFDESASASASPSGVSVSLMDDAAASVVVHVAGEVASPGIVELEQGQRVADAIAAAGGALDDADLSAVNLARVPQDGEQILVPARGEEAGSATSAGGRVSLSTADAATLETLPGVGPVLASRIVADREENGPFASVEDLARVSGIGDSLVSQLADLVQP